MSAKASAVVHVLSTQPRIASYGGAGEVARLASVNVATVTRTAQSLGFSGWPELQREVRARFLSSLSAPEVAAEHAAVDAAAGASLLRDFDDISLLRRGLDLAGLSAAVRTIAGAGRTVVIASGSYRAVGIALAHNASLAGYDVELLSGDPADVANGIARLGPGDAVVAISFWRLYANTIQVARNGRDQGATVCVLTDTASGPLAALADHLIVVAAEGVSFFPSLTPALAVVQAICAELATVDPERTGAAIERAEKMWKEFGILDRSPSRPDPPDSR